MNLFAHISWHWLLWPQTWNLISRSCTNRINILYRNTCAEFDTGNLISYLHLLSFFKTELAQVDEIIPSENWVLLISHNPYHGWWCPRDSRIQGMSTHAIDLVLPESYGFSPLRFTIQKHSYFAYKLVYFALPLMKSKSIPEIKCRSMLELLPFRIYLWTWLLPNWLICWRCHLYVMRHCFIFQCSILQLWMSLISGKWFQFNIQYGLFTLLHLARGWYFCFCKINNQITLNWVTSHRLMP